MSTGFERFALQLAREAGRVLLQHWRRLQRRDIHFKDHREVVTRADMASSRYLVRAIQRRFPTHGIVTEEASQSKSLAFVLRRGRKLSFGRSQFIWILDPLDGTNNFVMGSPLFGVNVGLVHRGELILGVTYLPATGDTYLARKDGGAYLNGKRLHVSPHKKLKDVPIIFCHGYTRADAQLNSLLYRRVHPKALVCRMWGAAGVEYGAVAQGGVGAFVFTGSKMWDIVPGILAVREAGGRVTDFDGCNWYLGMKPHKNIIVASNGTIHAELLRAIRGKIGS